MVAERQARWVADPHASGDARATPIIVDLNPRTAHIVRCWFPGRKVSGGLHQAFIAGAWVTVQERAERHFDHVCLASILQSNPVTIYGFVPLVPLPRDEWRMYSRFRDDGLDPDAAMQAVELILTPAS